MAPITLEYSYGTLIYYIPDLGSYLICLTESALSLEDESGAGQPLLTLDFKRPSPFRENYIFQLARREAWERTWSRLGTIKGHYDHMFLQVRYRLSWCQDHKNPP